MLLFTIVTIVKCCLCPICFHWKGCEPSLAYLLTYLLTCCFSQLSNRICFPLERLRAKSGNSLPPISPGRSAGESNHHKIKIVNFFFSRFRLCNTNEERVTNHHQDPHNHLSADGFHPRRERGARRQRGQPEHLQRIRSFQGV